MGRKLAITGINGFPGGPLLRWLDQMLSQGDHVLSERYDEIIALDLIPPRGKLRKTRFYKIDLTEPGIDQTLADLFEKEEVIDLVHLSFLINPRKNSSYAHELHSIGTMNLLNACSKQKVKKIVLNSTTYCYGAYPSNPNFLSEEHPLRGGAKVAYIKDRVDVENQMKTYKRQQPNCLITILRPCATLGPNINNFATRYLSRKICLTPLGYDPLIQLVHEEDVFRAFQMVLEKDVPGTFNIVGKGVLPLLTVLQLAGKITLPIVNSILYPMVQGLWQGNFAVVPPGYLDYLRYLWVADGKKAAEELGFVPKYSTKQTITSFAGVERLKKVHLAN